MKPFEPLRKELLIRLLRKSSMAVFVVYAYCDRTFAPATVSANNQLRLPITNVRMEFSQKLLSMEYSPLLNMQCYFLNAGRAFANVPICLKNLRVFHKAVDDLGNPGF